MITIDNILDSLQKGSDGEFVPRPDLLPEIKKLFEDVTCNVGDYGYKLLWFVARAIKGAMTAGRSTQMDISCFIFYEDNKSFLFRWIEDDRTHREWFSKNHDCYSYLDNVLCYDTDDSGTLITLAILNHLEEIAAKIMNLCEIPKDIPAEDIGHVDVTTD